MIPTVIALTGPAGSGKSTVADYLVKKYGAIHYSLATPLKEVAKRTLDLSYEQVYGTQAQKETVDPRYGFSPRWFLQRLGTEGCRAVFGEDFWTAWTLDMIWRQSPRLAVIDDARFANEAHAVLHDDRIAGFVWRLHPVTDVETTVRELAAGAHISEQEWRVADANLEIAPTQRGMPELLALIDKAMDMVTWEDGNPL